MTSRLIHQLPVQPSMNSHGPVDNLLWLYHYQGWDLPSHSLEKKIR